LIISRNILKSALLYSALFLTSLFVNGQSVLELLPGSEELSFDEKTGIHRLRGNVNFKYQGNLMFCDSAHYYQRTDEVHAYGKVHINKRDTLNLFCDSLYYNGKTRMAKLWGNVRVRDNEYKLTTDTLEYSARKGQAFYHHGGKVESIVSQEKLTSRIGYFYPESKDFYFSKEVKYRSKDLSMNTDTLRYYYSQKKTFFHGPTTILNKENEMYCEDGWYNTNTEEGLLQKNAWIKRPGEYISGDTLMYRPKEGVSIGKGSVIYADSAQKMTFKGDYAFLSDSLNYSFITGHALGSKELDDDTLHIHADTLYNYQKDSINIMKAFDHAKIYSSSFQAIADSMVFIDTADIIELHREPIVWADSAELKGEFIDIALRDSVVELVKIYNNASILMEVEPELYYNQIYGKDMIAHFEDNKLKQSFVYGNAITISYPENTESTDTTEVTERMGMNRLYSADMRIDLDSGEIVGVTYLDQPDGVFYPMDQIKSDEQFITSFNWKAALRPRSLETLLID
jgi:lipopolysaccharide assembly outer membrane protein LptD (OstA)